MQAYLESKHNGRTHHRQYLSPLFNPHRYNSDESTFHQNVNPNNPIAGIIYSFLLICLFDFYLLSLTVGTFSCCESS